MLLGADQAFQEEGHEPIYSTLDICRLIAVSLTASSVVALDVICFLVPRSILARLWIKNSQSFLPLKPIQVLDFLLRTNHPK